MSYQAKVIAGGKIVIPADVRRELGIADGDKLTIEVVDGTMTVTTRAEMIRRVQARYAHLKRPGRSLVDEFIAERRAEAAAEDAKDTAEHQRWRRDRAWADLDIGVEVRLIR